MGLRYVQKFVDEQVTAHFGVIDPRISLQIDPLKLRGVFGQLVVG
jgi:hypothetical protein